MKYCERSAVRKMIRISGEAAEERCLSPRYRQCSSYRSYGDESGDDRCPYLRDAPTRYCATASVTRFIPYNESLLSRCTNESYRYCDVYLAIANPAAPEAGAGRQDHTVAGIRMPGWLFYSANHMWLDRGRGGSCHLGIDGFLARALGTAERIRFLTGPGVHHPKAALTVGGADLEMVFPNAMLITAPNLYLRANPERLTADPYGVGWLFEGMELPGQAAVSSGLIRGEAIVPWVTREIARMSGFLAECRSPENGGGLMNDGGVFSADVVKHLRREDRLRLFREFFSMMRADHV